MKEFAQKLLTKIGKTNSDKGPLQSLGRSSILTVCADRTLLVVSDCRKTLPDGFEGEELRLDDGGIALCCAFSPGNAAALRRHYPWCAPRVPGGNQSTIGLGSWDDVAERLTLAWTNGLIPVFPAKTESDLRSADEATFAVFAAGYRDGFAVDGGRVSAIAGIEKPLAEGAGIVTLTPGGRPAADVSEYAGKRFVLNPQDALFVSREAAERCGGLYGGIVEISVAKRLVFDLGIALDDGESPTPGIAHIYTVRELRKCGVDCAVVFLQYGDTPEEIRASFRLHTAIYLVLGGYRLCLRPGSMSPELFQELRREHGGALHLEAEEAVWKQFRAYFPVSDLKAH